MTGKEEWAGLGLGHINAPVLQLHSLIPHTQMASHETLGGALEWGERVRITDWPTWDNVHTTNLMCTLQHPPLSDLRGTSMWKPVLGSFSPRRAGSSFLSFPSSQSMQTSRIARRTLHNQSQIDVMAMLSTHSSAHLRAFSCDSVTTLRIWNMKENQHSCHFGMHEDSNFYSCLGEWRDVHAMLLVCV